MSSCKSSSGTSVLFGVGDAIMVRRGSACPPEYGVVVTECTGGDVLEVQRLVQCATTKMWSFEHGHSNLNVEDVAEHISLHGDDGNAPRAWQQWGFRMVDGGTFVHADDECGTSSRLFPVGDPAFEVVSDDDDDNASDLDDFIVPDGTEAFTHAVGDSEFVRSTHDAVEWFTRWKPKDEREAAVKRGLLSLEARAAQLDDNARFDKGMLACNYNKPNAE